jgi:hypothetical protein
MMAPRAAFFAVILLAGCTPPPAPVAQAKPDPTTEAWYAQTVEQLAGMNRRAAKLFESGKAAEAASLVTGGEPLAARLLAPARPTLAAMEAASDLDQLYGRMLFANHRYGWARLTFQKNLIRWKTWKPQTPETLRRLKQAQTAIAECDRQLGQ